MAPFQRVLAWKYWAWEQWGVETEVPEGKAKEHPKELRRPLFYVEEEVSQDASSTRYL